MSAAAPPAAAREADLRAMVRDAVAFSLMVGVGETYVPAFVLAAGHGAVAAGLVATLPMLAGAVFQLVTPVASRRLGSYRRWVVACARLQALAFVPLVGAALSGALPLPWIFAASAAYWGFGMATGPAWNAWASALVPPERRARFFAHRSRLAQMALFAGITLGGVALDHSAGHGHALTTFGALFAAALVFRWISAAQLARQSEPAGLAAGQRVLSLGEVLASLRRGDAGRLLLYLLGMQVAVQVAAPFFTPFMLGHLKLSYWAFTALTASSFLARIAALPFLGRLAHRHGAGALLRLGAVGIVPLPALWLVSDRVDYLLVLQVLSGTAWAALELGTLLAFFEGLEESERASILSVFNFANTVAMAAGSLVGGLLLREIGTPGHAYTVLFVVSVTLRLAVLFLVPRRLRPVPVPEYVGLRTVAVRPAVGAIQRPILPTFAVDDAPPPATGEERARALEPPHPR